MAWTLAPSLKVLRDEINAAAPNRSKASDGTVGDLAHAARASDHNPNRAGVVRAFDVTHDPKNGVDCNVLTANIIERFGEIPALTSGSYVIWQGRIWSYDKRHLGWRDSSAHDKHAHISVATAASGYNSTAPWGVMGDDMPYTPQELQQIAANGVAQALTGPQSQALIQQIVWAKTTINRDGKPVPAIQELADAKSLALELQQRVELIEGTLGIDPAVVQEAVRQGVVDALASIETTVSVKADR